MKCMSCEMEINPKWSHAINMNACPFCGQSIMPENLKNLFSVLQTTIQGLLEYPDQLNDWMLSNYNYIKTDSPQLKMYLPKSSVYDKAPVAKEEIDKESSDNFIVKVKTDNGEEDVIARKIQSEDKTNDFFKRAEAVKPGIEGYNNTTEKTLHLKNLVKQIKKQGSPSLEVDESISVISPEMMEEASPEEIAEMQAALSGGDAISSSLSNGMDDDEIPAVVLNMAQSSKKGSANSKDLLKLQEMQQRAQLSRQNFESGASRGKGSFGRAG